MTCDRHKNVCISRRQESTAQCSGGHALSRTEAKGYTKRPKLGPISVASNASLASTAKGQDKAGEQASSRGASQPAEAEIEQRKNRAVLKGQSEQEIVDSRSSRAFTQPTRQFGAGSSPTARVETRSAPPGGGQPLCYAHSTVVYIRRGSRYFPVCPVCSPQPRPLQHPFCFFLVHDRLCCEPAGVLSCLQTKSACSLASPAIVAVAAASAAIHAAFKSTQAVPPSLIHTPDLDKGAGLEKKNKHVL